MTAPSREVRATVYGRDEHRCARCGARGALTYQHRQATGMGGTTAAATVEGGLTLCFSCNHRCEHDLQRDALAHGWKVPRWVVGPERVPVFYGPEQAWFVLEPEGWRRQITNGEAKQMLAEVYGEREGKSA